MIFKYILGALLSLPLMPVLYFQATRTRESMPDLPEAVGVSGKCTFGERGKKPLRLLALGESSIAGVGVRTHEEGFTGTFAKTLAELFSINLEWKVYAKSGLTARRVTDELVPQIRETDTDIIVVGLGGNDTFQLNTPFGWRRDILRLIDHLRQKCPNALIVFSSLPPVRSFPAFTPLMRFAFGNLTEILGEELHRTTRSLEGVFYHHHVITVEEWIERLGGDLTPDDFFCDGVHPSKLTHQTWGKELARIMHNDKERVMRYLESVM